METRPSTQTLPDPPLDKTVEGFGAQKTSRDADRTPIPIPASGNGWTFPAKIPASSHGTSDTLLGPKSLLTVGQRGTAAGEQEQTLANVEESDINRYLRNRRPSINFDPNVTLYYGDQEPLRKPVKPGPGSRSLFQGISDEPSQSARAQREPDRTRYDPSTGQPLPEYEDEMNGNRQSQIAMPTIPSSRSVHTSNDGRDLFLSPPHSPQRYPISYEETTPWQRNRRGSDRNMDGGQVGRRMGSMQGAHGQHFRRPTSLSAKSPGSAASSWLKRFSLGCGPDPVAEPMGPESEGQTIGDDYVLGRRIGFGGFSTIHEVTQMTSSGEQRKLAAKIVRKVVKDKSADENEQFQAEFGHEVELWRLLHHRHILPLETVWHTDEATYCFIPLIVGGTLLDLVRSNRSGLPTDLAKRYSYQLAVALRYLHCDARVAHRDVKLENCLLDTSVDPAEVRLCDFGMAEWISNDKDPGGSGPPSPSINSADHPRPRHIGPAETSSLAFAGGSLDYAAPETLRVARSSSDARAIVSPAVDIWAYGVCVYTMVVGNRPFYHAFRPRISTAILTGDWDREELRQKGGQDALDLVQNCLEMDAQKRWDIDGVLRSVWLKDMVDASEDQEDNFGSDWKL